VNYLFDINVLSGAQRPQPDARVLAWAGRGRRGPDLSERVVSIGEIARGVAQLEDGRREATPQRWPISTFRPLRRSLLSVDWEQFWSGGG